MPYVAPEVVQRVKQIDLLTYLKTYEPSELVHFSGNWIYRCAESACPVFWKSPVRTEEITVPDR